MAGDRKVLVVGAGLAGLAAAYTLSRDGFEVQVLEATPRLGGRVVQQARDGFRIDLGANFFLETYATTRRLAQQLGIPLRRTPVPIHSGIYRQGRLHGLYGGNDLASLWKTARTMLSLQLLSPRGLWQVFKFARLLHAQQDHLSFDDPAQLLKLDTDESAAELFATKIGAEALDWLFGPGLSGYTFADPQQIGAAYAMATLWHNGLNGVAWPCLPNGGAGAFVEALARACGADLRLSTPVRRIVLEHGVAQGVITDAGLVKADAVICATTASVALSITPDLPPAVRDTLRRVTYSKCCRVFFAVNSSPLPRDWYAVGFPQQTGTFLTGLSNPSLLAPETAPEGKTLIDALVIGAPAQQLCALKDEQVYAQVLAEVIRYLPDMSRTPLFSCVQRWPEAMCLLPGGTMTALQRLRQEGYGGVKRLCLAGDYMAVPSVNGALRSGLDAAAETAAQF